MQNHRKREKTPRRGSGKDREKEREREGGGKKRGKKKSRRCNLGELNSLRCKYGRVHSIPQSLSSLNGEAQESLNSPKLRDRTVILLYSHKNFFGKFYQKRERGERKKKDRNRSGVG